MALTQPELSPEAPIATKDRGPEAAPGREGFSPRRRWTRRLNTVIALALTLYCVSLFNLIIFRHPVRLDFTEEALFSLTDETRAKLDLVQDDIEVIVAHHSQPGNPQHIGNARLLQRALDILKEYNAYQPRVRLVEQINVFDAPDRWLALCEKHELARSQFNRIILISGDEKQSLSPQDLGTLEPGPDPSVPSRVKSFRGDQALSAAILRLADRHRKSIYFTQGHGELALLDLAPARGKRGQPAVLGALRHDLEGSGYETKAIEFSDKSGSTRLRIPEDAEALAIIGPTERFSSAELGALGDWLADGGRFFVSLGPATTGLEKLLERWGVEVEDSRVRTRIRVPGQTTVRDWVNVRQFQATHPVTEAFNEMPDFEMILLEPRFLRVSGGLRSVTSEAILTTGENAGSISNFIEDDASTLSPAEEKGNFILAAAVRPEILDRPPPGWKPFKTRIVVAGASNFLRDYAAETSLFAGYESASHRDFFLASVHWLAGEESLAVGGRNIEKRELRPLEGRLYWVLFASCVLVFPGVFALLGTLVYFLRRS